MFLDSGLDFFAALALTLWLCPTGISTTYWAARECGAAERLIHRHDILSQARNRLAELLVDRQFVKELRREILQQSDQSRQQNILSRAVVLVEIISEIFDPNTMFLFKREWTNGGVSFTSNFPLGVYLSL